MENKKLKPCPFCGSESIDMYCYDPYDGYQGNLSRWEICCMSCEVKLERVKREDAVNAWNRRANDGKS